MVAHDHVDTLERVGDVDEGPDRLGDRSGVHPFVAERDDHLDALAPQAVGLGLHRVDDVHDLERPQPAREEQARRVLGREADEAELRRRRS